MTIPNLKGGKQKIAAAGNLADVVKKLNTHHFIATECPICHQRLFGIGATQVGRVGGHAANTLALQIMDRFGVGYRPSFAFSRQRVGPHSRVVGKRIEMAIKMSCMKDDDIAPFENPRFFFKSFDERRSNCGRNRPVFGICRGNEGSHVNHSNRSACPIKRDPFRCQRTESATSKLLFVFS